MGEESRKERQPGHSKFGAQVSVDPIGPTTWQDLASTGKRRTVTGHPSGTLVWVRFRTVRGQAQRTGARRAP